MSRPWLVFLALLGGLIGATTTATTSAAYGYDAELASLGYDIGPHHVATPVVQAAGEADCPDCPVAVGSGTYPTLGSTFVAPTSAADDLLSTACRTNSFVPGTEVLMADGTTKPIEEIEIGDWVWAHDPETGEAGPRRVIDTIVGDGNKHLVDVGLLGDTIVATDGHPFWVTNDGAWIDAGDLEAGDRLLLADGRTTPITAIDERVTGQTVYNLTVDDIHTYYVQAGDEQVLVHNCRPEAGILGSKKHGS